MRRHATPLAALLMIATGCGGGASSARFASGEPEQATAPAPAREARVVMIAAPTPEPERAAEEAPPPGPAVATGSSWSMFHGDIGRTGFSEAPSVTSPVLLWRAKVGVQGWLNAPVIAGALVLIPSSGTKHNAPDAMDGVTALELSSGKVMWRAHFDKDANGAAVAGDKVLATSDDGNVYALDVQTGKALWKKRGAGKMYSSPLVVGDRVIVGDSAGVLRALSINDGTQLWQAQLVGAIRGGASADSERIYAVSQGGLAVAVRPDGKEVWRKRVTRPSFGNGAPTPIEAYSPPVITQTAVVISFARDTTYDTPALIALDKVTGSVQWEAQGQPGGPDWGNVRTTPALTASGALVYAEPYSGDIAGINAADGTVRFRATVGPCFFPQWASPAATADLVYVPRFDGALYAVRPDTGKPVWQLYLGDEQRMSTSLPSSHRSGGCSWEVPSGFPLYSPPAIAADGTIVIGSGEGFVFAIADSTKR